MHRSCCCMPDICQCRRTPGLPPRPHQRSVNGATAVAAAAAAGGSAGGLGLGLLKQRTKGAKFPSGLWALWALWSSKMAKTTSRKQPTRVRCVSIFLDKNRRYIGKSQSEQPSKMDATDAAPSPNAPPPPAAASASAGGGWRASLKRAAT
jgi:hypothetical protein